MAAAKKAASAATSVRRRTTGKKAAAAVTQEQIAERAYYLYLERGGDQLENWLHAERELAAA
jgi:hypothetical protein